MATGHWGCGAFGNNHDLMFLKQWLAASEAGVSKLHYHDFDRKPVAHNTGPTRAADIRHGVDGAARVAAARRVRSVESGIGKSPLRRANRDLRPNRAPIMRNDVIMSERTSRIRDGITLFSHRTSIHINLILNQTQLLAPDTSHKQTSRNHATPRRGQA